MRRPVVHLRRSADRGVTGAPGISTRSSFAFGTHYDPANTHFGPLLAHNEHELQPGHGFPPHLHRDLVIVTWVLSGLLRHEDSTGRGELVAPGTVQWLSAGTGVQHSEGCAPGAGATRFVQAWLPPDRYDDPPAYGSRDVSAELAVGRLVPVAGGDAGLPPRQLRGAVLWVGRLLGDVALPDAARVHVHVATGRVRLETDAHAATSPAVLEAGDAARLEASSARLLVSSPAEVLVWQLAGP